MLFYFVLFWLVLTRTCSVNLIEFHHMFFGIFWFLSDYRRNIELFYFVLFCSILAGINPYLFGEFNRILSTLFIGFFRFFKFSGGCRRNIELFYFVLFWHVFTLFFENYKRVLSSSTHSSL